MRYADKLRALKSVRECLISQWKDGIYDRHKLAKQIMNVNLLISRAEYRDPQTLRHVY